VQSPTSPHLTTLELNEPKTLPGNKTLVQIDMQTLHQNHEQKLSIMTLTKAN